MKRFSITVVYLIVLFWVLSNQFVGVEPSSRQPTTPPVAKPAEKTIIGLVERFLNAGDKRDLEAATALFRKKSLEEGTSKKLSEMFQDRSLFAKFRTVKLDEVSVAGSSAEAGPSYLVKGRVNYARAPSGDFSALIVGEGGEWKLASIQIIRSPLGK